MFKLASNTEIGEYLSKLIDENYKSTRQFGIAYIKLDGGEANEEEIKKMANRLSQIRNGNKGIQIFDLPIFSQLLSVSCEEILSAGKSFLPSSNHLTNYSVALSSDRKVWESYVQREDSIVLNADEYGKTLIHYALDFKNYDLLKFLLDEEYIWFIGADRNDYWGSFGAGTSIKYHPIEQKNYNVLDSNLKEESELWTKMIVLAIENNDFETLTDLKARELPSFYQACYLSCTPAKCEEYYNEAVITAIAKSKNSKIINYFAEEFEIIDRINLVNKFVFPFMSELIERMIKSKHNEVTTLLKSAIKHNIYAYEKINKIVADWESYFNELFNADTAPAKNVVDKAIYRELDFYDDGNMVSMRSHNAKDGIVTNIIKVNTKSDNAEVNALIDELNELFEKIHNIKPRI